MPAARPLKERFEEKYIPEPNSGCWLWEAGLGGRGYGLFSTPTNPKGALAHRVSWELHRGPIPEGKWVLHKCDVRCCVNPSHLFLGDHQDNMTDMKVKGRAKTCRGSKHKKSKLTDDLVNQIRSSSENNMRLAERFGVSNVLISMVRLNKIWRHV